MKTTKILCCCLVFFQMANGSGLSPSCEVIPNSHENALTSFEEMHTMIKDKDNNLFMVGESENSGNHSFFIAKLKPNCSVMWVRTWDGHANRNDQPFDLETDELGAVYVTGFSEDANLTPHIATVKYDASGNFQWASIYNSPFPASGIGRAIKRSGDNVYVTGYLDAPNHFIHGITIKYNRATGAQVWESPFTASDYCLNISICVDLDGNAYVTGEDKLASPYHFSKIYTVRYRSSDGSQDWMQYHNLLQSPIKGVNWPNRIVYGSNHVFIGGTGYNYITNTNDYQVFCYDLNGNLAWDYELDWDGRDDAVGDIYVDPGNDVLYVTGGAETTITGTLSMQTATLALNPSTGVFKWSNLFNATGYDYNFGLEIDLDCKGQPYIVSGSLEQNYSGMAYMVVNYSSATGYASYASYYYSSPLGVHDIPNDIVVTQDGAFVSGTGPFNLPVDFIVAKFTGVPSGNKCNTARLSPNDQGSFSESISAFPNPTTGSFVVTSDQQGTISLLDVQGRRLKNYFMENGDNSLDISHLENGMYYLQYKSQDGKQIKSEKILLNK